jgi:hypothetical protein
MGFGVVCASITATGEMPNSVTATIVMVDFMMVMSLSVLIRPRLLPASRQHSGQS